MIKKSIALLFLAGIAWASISQPKYDIYSLDTSANSVLRVRENFKDLYANKADRSEITSFQNVPAGIIVMWSGAISNIPDGWALCDGANGTPDLKDRFILSVGTSEEPGATGGSTTHIHTVEGHAHGIVHTHTYSGSATTPSFLTFTVGDYQYTTDGGNKSSHQHAYSGTTSGSSAANSGSASPATDAQSNVPPYFKLAFIMKL